MALQNSGHPRCSAIRQRGVAGAEGFTDIYYVEVHSGAEREAIAPPAMVPSLHSKNYQARIVVEHEFLLTGAERLRRRADDDVRASVEAPLSVQGRERPPPILARISRNDLGGD